jgi:hypothetical protein
MKTYSKPRKMKKARRKQPEIEFKIAEYDPFSIREVMEILS